ncbi:hypothetical protein TSUD_211260 [Trifolium subterraneum]|uniref:U2A'/phosphoprotein 32 family A C-terminal domain-containing protein n=1 Tax=Trifolium subterraneum TaxID=3900 RepID=A0A2Z6N866_TRISU|nr:hypothetical protein TSUD_211260 [Trifolium subterraneum]
MTILKCFYDLNERKVNKKAGREKSSKESFDTLLAKLHHSLSSETRDSEPNPFGLTVNNGFQKTSRSNVSVMSLENRVKGEVREAYEGGNENENPLSIKRELSDFDLQFDEPVASNEGYDPTGKIQATDEFEDQSDRYCRKNTDTKHSGYMSDPGNNIIDVDDQRRSGSSSYARVDAWVKDLEIQEPVPEDDLLDDNAESISFPPSHNAGRQMIRNISQMSHTNSNLSKDILKANCMVQSLNPASSNAHISGVGIKAIPIISHFSNLRSVNLSNNFIVCISPGCLPKSVQTLNLSRNKITTIDGLKELTRLRILDLSYNCITRIGQGLSSCTLIRELYLAGNKISDVEGLHRLFKLTVLDLSFNKITTTKVLGQLVANYNSLLVLNLLGNAIQRNIGDEQLKKTVSGLLPKLVYLNKQPLKAQRAVREILTDRVAKAALGNNKKQNFVRRSMNRVGKGQGGSRSSKGHRSNASVAPNSRIRTKR